MTAKKMTAKKKKSKQIGRDEVVRLIETFDGEVNNGGFDQFFRNSAGNETAAVIRALEVIGAKKVLNIFKRSAKKFPGGIPPKSRSAREDMLERISPDGTAFRDLDQEFYSCSEELTERLEKYMGV